MYNTFYGFAHKPFSLTPDPDFLYLSPVHKRALAYLSYGLEEGKGFIRITGEVGSGKTILIRSLLRELSPNFRTAYVINPMASFDELLKYIITDLGIDGDCSGHSKVELLTKLYDFLLAEASRDGSVAIIFDEAQDLSSAALEEIRLLSNYETAKGKLLQIVFVGQPELRDKLDMPQLRQLKQRISVSYHIEPLDRLETERYITHRISVAQPSKEIVFAEEAYSLIHQYTGGVPRLINIVCDAMLLTGYVKERYELDAPMAEETIAEIASESGLMTKIIRALPTDPKTTDAVGQELRSPEPDVDRPSDYAPVTTCGQEEDGLGPGTHPTKESEEKKAHHGSGSQEEDVRSLHEATCELLHREETLASDLTSLAEKIDAAFARLPSQAEPDFQKQMEERLSQLEALGAKMERAVARVARAARAKRLDSGRLDSLESKIEALRQTVTPDDTEELKEIIERVCTAHCTLEETLITSVNAIKEYRFGEDGLRREMKAMVDKLEEEGKNLSLTARYLRNAIKNVYARLNDIERKMWKKPTWLRNLFRALGRSGPSNGLPEWVAAELGNTFSTNQLETRRQEKELGPEITR